MRPRGSLPGTENLESLGVVTSTRGQRLSLVSVNEKISWSTAIRRYLQQEMGPVIRDRFSASLRTVLKPANQP